MSWHWVDLLIIGIMLLSIITGLIRGFVKELVSVLVWILAIFMSYKYANLLHPWLSQYIEDKTIKSIAAFVLVLVMVLLAGGIVNALLSYLLKRSGLNGTDRVLGMVFGFIRGVFIVSLLMLVAQLTAFPYEEYAKESKLYHQFDPIVRWLSGFTPEFIKKAKAMDPNKSLIDFQIKQAIHPKILQN